MEKGKKNEGNYTLAPAASGGGVTMIELKPCPFCGGEIDERGGQCNYGKKIMTLDLKCKKCETLFKFKSKWHENPYREVIEAWNRRVGEEDKRD